MIVLKTVKEVPGGGVVVTVNRLLHEDERTMIIDVKSKEEFLTAFNKDEPIQVRFPKLNPTQREFLISGLTADEQDEVFKEFNAVDGGGE